MTFITRANNYLRLDPSSVQLDDVKKCVQTLRTEAARIEDAANEGCFRRRDLTQSQKERAKNQIPLAQRYKELASSLEHKFHLNTTSLKLYCLGTAAIGGASLLASRYLGLSLPTEKMAYVLESIKTQIVSSQIFSKESLPSLKSLGVAGALAGTCRYFGGSLIGLSPQILGLAGVIQGKSPACLSLGLNAYYSYKARQIDWRGLVFPLIALTNLAAPMTSFYLGLGVNTFLIWKRSFEELAERTKQNITSDR